MSTQQEERPLRRRNKCEVYNDYDTEYSLFAEYGDTLVLVANVSGNIFGLSMRDLEGLRKMCEMILACYRGK